jgi:hypothetical protein
MRMYQSPGGYGMQSSNNSGQGEGTAVPPEAQGLNWGSFFFTWIWAIVNNAGALWIVIGLLAGWLWPIPNIVFLIKGNELAWQNKRWDSVEAFKAHQRKWAIAGLILLGISLVVFCISMILILVLSAASSSS